MKALKEKRISLRALWRRSLVILSLLALVLAVGCGDSNGGNGDVEARNPPVSITVAGDATADSFQGLRPNLEGFTFVVTYADGSSRAVDHNDLAIDPPFVQGFFLHAGSSAPVADERLLGWAPQVQFRVGYAASGAFVVSPTFTIPASRLHGIVRTNIDQERFANQNLLVSSGFVVHGANRMQQSYFVDEAPNFSGLAAEVWYSDGSVKEFYLNDLPAGAVTGVIHPTYENMPATGPGWLFVTFGRHQDYDLSVLPTNQVAVGSWAIGPAGDIPAPVAGLLDGRTASLDVGVTQIIRVPEVFHVTGIEFQTPPAIDAVFYWESNSPGLRGVFTGDNWRARAAGTVFNVTYSNNVTRQWTIEQLDAMPEVWLNTDELLDPAGVPGSVAVQPFRVTGITVPPFHADTTAAARRPRVTFYYRGWDVYHIVPVLTEVSNIRVERDWTGTLAVNRALRATWDNDRWILPAGFWDAQRFADAISVQVTYAARMDPRGVTRTFEAIYLHDLSGQLVNLDTAEGATGASRLPPTGVDVHFDLSNPASATEFFTQVWTAADIAGNVASPTGVTSANIGRVFGMDFGNRHTSPTDFAPAPWNPGDFNAAGHDGGWGLVGASPGDAAAPGPLPNRETRQVRFWFGRPAAQPGSIGWGRVVDGIQFAENLALPVSDRAVVGVDPESDTGWRPWGDARPAEWGNFFLNDATVEPSGLNFSAAEVFPGDVRPVVTPFNVRWDFE